MSASKLKTITKRLEQYKDKLPSIYAHQFKERQDRLKQLIAEHSIEHVALASGLSEDTLRQYTRVSTPVSISEKAVTQAECILKDL